MLQLSLQIELLVEVREQRRVERLLRARVGARRSGGEPRDQLVRGVRQLRVGVDGVDQLLRQLGFPLFVLCKTH